MCCSRKESYELDYCYDQYEDNGIIFSREVKPLIPGVLGGCNATVVTLGARGSGKTCLIQVGSISPQFFPPSFSLLTIFSFEIACIVMS